MRGTKLALRQLDVIRRPPQRRLARLSATRGSVTAEYILLSGLVALGVVAGLLSFSEGPVQGALHAAGQRLTCFVTGASNCGGTSSPAPRNAAPPLHSEAEEIQRVEGGLEMDAERLDVDGVGVTELDPAAFSGMDRTEIRTALIEAGIPPTQAALRAGAIYRANHPGLDGVQVADTSGASSTLRIEDPDARDPRRLRSATPPLLLPTGPIDFEQGGPFPLDLHGPRTPTATLVAYCVALGEAPDDCAQRAQRIEDSSVRVEGRFGLTAGSGTVMRSGEQYFVASNAHVALRWEFALLARNEWMDVPLPLPRLHPEFSHFRNLMSQAPVDLMVFPVSASALPARVKEAAWPLESLRQAGAGDVVAGYGFPGDESRAPFGPPLRSAYAWVGRVQETPIYRDFYHAQGGHLGLAKREKIDAPHTLFVQGIHDPRATFPLGNPPHHAGASGSWLWDGRLIHPVGVLSGGSEVAALLERRWSWGRMRDKPRYRRSMEDIEDGAVPFQSFRRIFAIDGATMYKGLKLLTEP